MTLEQIGHVVNGLGAATARGQGPPAWTVALDDLETITDVLSRGAQFVHYLERRADLVRFPTVATVDELALLERYLHTSLRESAADFGGADVFMFDPASKTIDAFEQGKASGNVPVVPKHNVPDAVLRLIDQLANSHGPGWLDVGIALLELPHRLQRSLARQIQKIQRGGGKTEITISETDGTGRVTVRIADGPVRDLPLSGITIVVDRSWKVLQTSGRRGIATYGRARSVSRSPR